MRYLIGLLAIAGIVVSAMALQVHYSTDTPPCSINAHWDCGIVNHSRYAMIGSVPVAAIGILGYAALLITLFFDRKGRKGRTARYVLLTGALIGMGFALYLTSIEARILEVWCLYCVISQAIITLITVLSVAHILWEPKEDAAY
ncbi:MAG: vitamin K epoxide reductase family protein [Acidobacteriaceae bacterium]